LWTFIVMQIVAVALLAYGVLRHGSVPNATCIIGVFLLPAAGLIALSSVFVFFFVKPMPLRVLAFVLVLGEAYAAFTLPLELLQRRLETFDLANPAQFVADARRLIASAKGEERWIRGEEVPPSLRIPQLFRLQVHQDHVDLVTASHPDGTLGFRIWSADATRARKEPPTKYADIFLYHYNNDYPEAPDNIP
jgi:hypothetical protein